MRSGEFGLKYGPSHLPHRRLVAVVALRRRRQLLRHARNPDHDGETEAARGKRTAQDAAAEKIDVVRHDRLLVRHLQAPLVCAPRTRTSMSSTAFFALASLPASRARSTTLVFGPRAGSKNG